MNKLTSMADFYDRVKSDERYKLVIIAAYKQSSPYLYGQNPLPANYDNSIKWVETWIENRKKSWDKTSPFDCHEMIDHLNKMMDKIPIFTSKLISPHKINNFTSYEQMLNETNNARTSNIIS